MLVAGVRQCDLVSYAMGSCRIFHLERDAAWLAHLQSTYIMQGYFPSEEALIRDMPDLHEAFLAATIK